MHASMDFGVPIVPDLSFELVCGHIKSACIPPTSRKRSQYEYGKGVVGAVVGCGRVESLRDE